MIKKCMVVSMDETPMVSIKWQALALPKASSGWVFKMLVVFLKALVAKKKEINKGKWFFG